MTFALVLIGYLAFIVWIGKVLRRRQSSESAAYYEGFAAGVGFDPEGVICECGHPRPDIDGACTRCHRLVIARG